MLWADIDTTMNRARADIATAATDPDAASELWDIDTSTFTPIDARPPVDPDGFDEFAASLQFPDIHNVTAVAEPLDDPVRHRFPASMWRHCERLRRHRTASRSSVTRVCSLDPIYGQGMSVAASVDALGQHLSARAEFSSAPFMRIVSWLDCCARRGRWRPGPISMFPGVEGRRTPVQGAIGANVTRLHAAAANDSTLSRAFARVAALVDPPDRTAASQHRRPRPAR